jgi:hypothetical protein
MNVMHIIREGTHGSVGKLLTFEEIVSTAGKPFREEFARFQDLNFT